MKKLNLRKIRWILGELKRGELSVYKIARQQGVSPRWVRQLPKKYSGIPLYEIKILKPGRKKKPIPEEERELVIQMRKEHPFGAVNLEKLLNQRGRHLPHNRIHRILRDAGLAKSDWKKQKRRKWVRYERRHSNSLWHTDWFEHKGELLVFYEDDASRFIPSFGAFRKATAENSARVFEEGAKRYGTPKQLLSDHGVQFTSNETEKCKDPKFNIFQQTLASYGVRHIKARIKHPQTNGKMERLVQTLRVCKEHFGSWEKAVEYYNFRRPHMSLENGRLRTPHEAFVEKARKAKNS